MVLCKKIPFFDYLANARLKSFENTRKVNILEFFNIVGLTPSKHC